MIDQYLHCNCKKFKLHICQLFTTQSDMKNPFSFKAQKPKVQNSTKKYNPVLARQLRTEGFFAVHVFLKNQVYRWHLIRNYQVVLLISRLPR